jgi:hypothetical protein
VGYVPLVAFEVYEMGVNVGVFKFLMAKNALDEFDVLGSVARALKASPRSHDIQNPVSQMIQLSMRVR